MRGTYSRTIAKTISWRVIGVVVTCVSLYIATGQVSLSLAVGVIDAIVKSVLYFMHERTWEKIEWGNDDKRG